MWHRDIERIHTCSDDHIIQRIFPITSHEHRISGQQMHANAAMKDEEEKQWVGCWCWMELIFRENESVAGKKQRKCACVGKHRAVTLTEAMDLSRGPHLKSSIMIDGSLKLNLQDELVFFSSLSLSHSWYFPSVLLVSGDKGVIVHRGNHRTHMLLGTESEWSHIG